MTKKSLDFEFLVIVIKKLEGKDYRSCVTARLSNVYHFVTAIRELLGCVMVVMSMGQILRNTLSIHDIGNKRFNIAIKYVGNVT